MRYLLLTNEELHEIIEFSTNDRMVSMALELEEYRRIMGPLGCQWLDAKDRGGDADAG